MKIAELFINLGIKGNVKTRDALAGVHGALQEAKNTSWELKAGIAGAVFALEEITRHAVGTANDLKAFAGATGLSTDELQKWGYWAEINNVKAENMASTIKNLQALQSDLLLGQGDAAGANYFGLSSGQSQFQLFEALQKKLREIGNDAKEIGKARTMASRLGITDDMFAALRIGTVGFAGLTKQMTLTETEWKKLNVLGQEWTKFWLTISGTTDKSIANNLTGPIIDAVHVLKNAVTELGDLGDQFHKALKKFSPNEITALKLAFEALAAGMVLAFAPLGPWILGVAALAKVLDEVHKFKNGEKNIFSDDKNEIERMKAEKYTKEDYRRDLVAIPKDAGLWLASLLGLTLKDRPGFGEKEQMGPPAPVTVHITNHNHDVKDGEHLGEQMSKQIINAVIQSPAFNQAVSGQSK